MALLSAHFLQLYRFKQVNFIISLMTNKITNHKINRKNVKNITALLSTRNELNCDRSPEKNARSAPG